MAIPPAEIAHGPMLIGTGINVLLYGITISQLYLYHTSANRDRRWIQGFVYLLFLGDTIQTLFTVLYLYDSLIKHFGNATYLLTANWIFSTDPALTGILGGLVQAFFAWRVKVLTGSLIITTIIMLCAASSFFMGIATAVAIGIVPHFVEFQKFKVVVIIWLVSASFADITITGSLVFYLRQNRTGFAQTDTYVDRIIRCLITAIWAFIDLMVYLMNPTGLHLLFNFPLSKLYTNSLMSSLNARTFWLNHEVDGNAQATFGKNTAFRMSTLKDGSEDGKKPIQRDTEVFVHVESLRVTDPQEKVECGARSGTEGNYTRSGSAGPQYSMV